MVAIVIFVENHRPLGPSNVVAVIEPVPLAVDLVLSPVGPVELVLGPVLVVGRALDILVGQGRLEHQRVA